MKKFLLPIIFALAMTNAFSANCYWVGGGTVATPSDWYTAANWSTNSVPGSGDVAIFDGRANNLNPYVSIGGYSINIAGLQVYPATGATANNVLSLVGNSSPFTITGDLTINTVKPASTQYNGQISDNGNNTISVGGNILTNATSSFTLVTVPSSSDPATNPNAGKILLTGSNPVIMGGAVTNTASLSATATVASTPGPVTSITITNGGSGYFYPPVITFSNGGGSGASATASVSGGVLSYTNLVGGSGYTSAPTVTLSYPTMVFQQLDISGSTNASTCATIQINGNLNIQSGGKLTMSNQLTLNSTNGTPFNQTGTITGSGVIVPLNTNTFKVLVQGTVPGTLSMSSPQTVGTINFDQTVTTQANSINISRANALTTIGNCNNNTFTVSGSLNLNTGIIDDGGNTLVFGFPPIITSTNTTLGNAIHRGTGRIRAQRSTTTLALLTTGAKMTVGNLEIGTGSAGATYPLGGTYANSTITQGAATLVVNGTLTLSKAASGIDASFTGSSLTVNGGLVLAAGALTTGGNVTLGNGCAITRLAGTLSAAPTFGTSTDLTYGGQTTQIGTTTASSSAVTLSAANPNIYVGMTVTGTGIPAGVTVSNITSNILTLSTGTGVTAGTNTLTFGYNTAQTSGFELPSSSTVLRNLSVYNTAGVTLGAATTVNGILTLGAGTLTNGTNLTMVTGTSITRLAGSLTAVPTFGTTLDLSYGTQTTQTGTTTAGSATVTLSAANANIFPGMGVAGVNIPASVTVAAISGTTLTLSTGTNVTAGTGTLTFTYGSAVTQSVTTTASNAAATLSATNANILPGMTVVGTGIPAGVTVSTVSGTSLTLSTGTGVAAGTNTLTFMQTTGPELPTSSTVLRNLSFYNNGGVGLASNLTPTVNNSLTIGGTVTSNILAIGAAAILNFVNGSKIYYTGTGATTYTTNGKTSGFKIGSSSADKVDLYFSNTSGTAKIIDILATNLITGGINSLTVNGVGGTCSINTSTTLNTGLTIGAGATLDLVPGYNFTLQGGNWNNAGTFTSHSNATGSIISFKGSSQTINNTSTGSESFYNFTFDNASGTLTANCNITVPNVLALTNGKISTGSYTLTVGSAGSITGASSSNYVNGNLAMIYGATGSKTFPVGKGGNYRPVTINAAALDVTPSTFTVNQVESTFSGTLPRSITSNLARNWTVAQTGSTAYTYDLTLTGTGFTPTGTAKILQNNAGTVSSYSTTGTYTSTGLSSVGSFGLGDFVPVTPAAPTAATATAGNTQASVAFTAPADNGGSTILDYTVTSSPGGFTATGASSPIVVTGLSNGTAYTFTVTARNSLGSSSASTASNSVTPKGNSSILVTGATSFYYNGSAQGPATASVTGSAGAVTYSYAGTGTTTYGPSATAPTSVGSYTVTASVAADTYYNGASSSATGFTIDKGNSSVTITGTTSFNYNGSAQGPATASVTGSTAALTYSYVGVSGTTYSESATAPTAVGSYTVTASVAADANYNGASSSPTGFTISAVVPGAPTIGTATIGNAQASVAFTAPTSDGGSSIIDYTLTSSPGNYTVTGASSPLVVTGLSNGTAYTFTVTARNSVGSSPASSASNSTTPAPTTVSVSGNSNLSSYFPASITDVTVNSGEITVDADATVKTMTVAPGAKLTLASGKSLSVVGALTLQSDASGTATFVDNGGTLTAGTTNVQQYLTTGRNWYISSPVSGAYSSVFNAAAASNINKLYWYDETQGSNATFNWPQITDNSTSLAVTKGYVANVDASLLATTNGVTFTGGSLNTGDITTGTNGVPALSYSSSQAKSGFNLVGNPYPSYLKWSTVTKTNLLSNTMWYRTKVSGTYYFYTYNSVDGAAGIGISVPADVTNLIPPMQAFWVRAAGSGASLTFHNTDRAHKDVTNNLLRTKAQISSIMQVARLQVSNGVNSDETVLYTYPDASNQYDSYDSPKMTNANAAIPEIYTTVSNENLVINGMNSIPYDTEIPLGFTTGSAGTFSIKASQIANFDAGTQILLKDNVASVSTDLSDGSSYMFTSDITNNNTSRFALIFKSSSVATGVNSGESSNLWISVNGANQIVLNGNDAESSVYIYNAIGQKVYSKNLTSGNTSLETTLQSGVYVVSVRSGANTVSKKVIID